MMEYGPSRSIRDKGRSKGFHQLVMERKGYFKQKRTCWPCPSCLVPPLMWQHVSGETFILPFTTLHVPGPLVPSREPPRTTQIQPHPHDPLNSCFPQTDPSLPDLPAHPPVHRVPALPVPKPTRRMISVMPSASSSTIGARRRSCRRRWVGLPLVRGGGERIFGFECWRGMLDGDCMRTFNVDGV